MQQDGTIREYDLTNQKDALEHQAALAKRLSNLAAGLRQEETPITSDQARFFKTKGPVFRALWGKRLSRGLTPTQALQLKGLIDDFAESEKSCK